MRGRNRGKLLQSLYGNIFVCLILWGLTLLLALFFVYNSYLVTVFIIIVTIKCQLNDVFY